MRAALLWLQLRWWQTVEYLCLRFLGHTHREALETIRFEEAEARERAMRQLRWRAPRD